MIVKKVIIRATGLIEDICEHGIGHPQKESARKLAKKYGHTIKTWMVHGCDRCCQK